MKGKKDKEEELRNISDKEPKGRAQLRLMRNWCDVVRGALGTRELSARILLQRYEFGPGEEPLLVATGLRERPPSRQK